jgi:hypothetical protein
MRTSSFVHGRLRFIFFAISAPCVIADESADMKHRKAKKSTSQCATRAPHTQKCDTIDLMPRAVTPAKSRPTS